MRVRARGDDPRVQARRVRGGRRLRGGTAVRAHDLEGEDVPGRLHHVRVGPGMSSKRLDDMITKIDKNE